MIKRIEVAPGFEISRVLTGLWQVADMERDGSSVDPDVAVSAMRRYVDAGFSTFDMADHYGSSELLAGEYGSRHPGSAEFLTKWVPQPGTSTRADVEAAVQRAADRLRVDRIPLLQFHAWKYSDPGWMDCIFHLQELTAEGRIGHLGLTNTDTAHLAMLLDSGVPIVSNQICYSLLDRRASGAMTELCVGRGVGILAFGTLAGGFLTDRWLGLPEPSAEALETWSQMKYKRFIDVTGGWEPFQALLRALRQVADRHHATVANIACRWVLERPSVAGIIVGARLGIRDHMEESKRLFSIELTDEDHLLIDEALGALDNVPGDCGDEYRRPPFLTAAGDLSDHFDEMPSPYRVEQGADGVDRALSGTVWEDLAGFSRAIRRGDRIFVSGTTATHRDRLIGGDSAASQAHFCLDKIEGAIESLGGTLDDIVRTRIYVAEPGVAEAVSRAHGSRLGQLRPANTLVQAGLIGDGYLVEMEAEAVVTNR